MQALFKTTMTEYKGVLKNWHKGTGGGPGLDIYFQSWSTEKLNKYDIDLSDYDHTLVASRPAIMFENYINDSANKKPYLTIIHMWDDVHQNLLSSKFDPFNVEGGGGEIGCDSGSSEDECQDSTLSPSNYKVDRISCEHILTPALDVSFRSLP